MSELFFASILNKLDYFDLFKCRLLRLGNSGVIFIWKILTNNNLLSNLPAQHLVLCFCNVADVVRHVPQIDNRRAHLFSDQVTSKPLSDDDGDLADDHLVHVLLHLLLPRVLLSRLTGRRNEAVIRVQSLGDKQCD